MSDDKRIADKEDHPETEHEYLPSGVGVALNRCHGELNLSAGRAFRAVHNVCTMFADLQKHQ